MTEQAAHSAGASIAAPQFDMRPLLVSATVCTVSMMAFVALIGPLARVFDLRPWQAGATVTVSGVLWMVLAPMWGRLSDSRGRRAALLACIAGFAVSYIALCVFVDLALRFHVGAFLAFAGLLISRAAIGAFYAGVPTTSFALVADHTPPEKRASAMAAMGAANAVGMVAGPSLAGLLAQQSLAMPFHVTAILPVIAFAVLWRGLPVTQTSAPVAHARPKLTDPRLARPMAVAFVASSAVSVSQIAVGFFAFDRFKLSPEDAAHTAGIALTCVGVALVAAQMILRRLAWPPATFIRIGCLVATCGYLATAGSLSPLMLWASSFVAAAGMGWVFPAFSALAANAVETHEQGAAAGAVAAAQGLGMVVGPLAGSLTYEITPSTPYLMTAAALLACGLWPTRKP